MRERELEEKSSFLPKLAADKFLSRRQREGGRNFQVASKRKVAVRGLGELFRTDISAEFIAAITQLWCIDEVTLAWVKAN